MLLQGLLELPRQLMHVARVLALPSLSFGSVIGQQRRPSASLVFLRFSGLCLNPRLDVCQQLETG